MKEKPKKKKCGKSYYPNCDNCPYKHSCEILYFNERHDEWEAYHKQEIKHYEEKIKILEEEREKWWSKAEKPDDCYITIEGHKDKMVSVLEGLKVDGIYSDGTSWDELEFNRRVDEKIKEISK